MFNHIIYISIGLGVIWLFIAYGSMQIPNTQQYWDMLWRQMCPHIHICNVYTTGRQLSEEEARSATWIPKRNEIWRQKTNYMLTAFSIV